jgi:iron complex outermembrane recepter protein
MRLLPPSITLSQETAHVATVVEVIVTGSNIPTAEEVGPQPVDTYRRVDIERLGVRTATDLIEKLPVATGPSINENINAIGGGQTEIDLRGLGSKETLVLQDGLRLAPDGLAGYDVGFKFFFWGYTRPQPISPWAD